MKRHHPLLVAIFVVVLMTCWVSDAAAIGRRFRGCIKRLNRSLCGHVVDHTNNHGRDCRIWSAALQQKRDLYVYLPPHFDPHQQYPIMLWLHSFGADESQFLQEAITSVDRAMACGQLPPTIIAIPDGTKAGRGGFTDQHSGFLNTRLGRYGDYLLCDVWKFVNNHYPIRPERKAHVLGGVSLGGGAAYHHGIKHRDRFGIVLGIYPPLNTRWIDCRGKYFGNFRPDCACWRTNIDCVFEPLGIYAGIFPITVRQLITPLYGRGGCAIAGMARDNPVEIMIRTQLKPGELSMFVAYGGRDEFNLDAQIESFLYHAHNQGIQPTVSYSPRGRHNLRTAKSFFPEAIQWLAPQLAPYAPGKCAGPVVIGSPVND
ncbi:MAG: alpha/beta hydrolase-fold protein [Gemmataceae bacterium]